MPQISQKRSASITIDLTPEQQEEYKEIAAGRAALNKREDDLRKAIRALPEVKIAANLAGTGLGRAARRTLISTLNRTVARCASR